jgi:RHS repeat-associated protein
MARGTLNTPRTALTSETFAQCWTLDSTGNWQGFREDDNGDGTWDLIQARTANKVNEITNISETAGPSWVTPAYSAVGNMTTVPQPADPTQSYTPTYDAWHRLVKVADGSDTVSEYAYDGTRRRIIQKSYTNGTLSETRHMYYTQPSQWQVLEERVGTSTDAERQFVWGLRYIDDCVLRDRDTNADGTLDQRLYPCQDANWNVTTLTGAAGDVQERDAYSAYGVPLFLTPTFGSRAASSFGWETLYCGYRYETATGLFHIRWRWLLSQLASWISRDSQIHPAPGDSSLYEYAGSSPLTYVDLDGRQLQQAQAQKTCKFRVCATAIPGVPIAKHLLTIVDGIAYRCGPSGKGKETDNCGCEPFGDYGQLVCTSGKYEEGFVDWVEPAQENCEEFEVPNADCDTIGKCFGNVLKAVESCCVNYVPAPADASKGCNSNCAVNWMLSACFEKAPKVIFGQKPGIAPGFQVKPPDCIKENAKK